MDHYEQEDELVLTPVHRSLIRVDLILGCERAPVIFLFAFAFLFVMILQNAVSVGAGIFIVVGGIPILRWLAGRDAEMYRVYTRHISYQDEYGCHPSPARKPFMQIDQQRKKGSTA